MATVQTLREKARRRLPKIHARDGGICHYCQCETVILRRVPAERRLGIADFKATFIDEGGSTVTMPIASVDHVKELRRGGSSDITNLVLACVKCNHDREHAYYRSLTKAQRRQAFRIAQQNHEARERRRIKRKLKRKLKQNGNPQTTGHCQWPHSAVA